MFKNLGIFLGYLTIEMGCVCYYDRGYVVNIVCAYQCELRNPWSGKESL